VVSLPYISTRQLLRTGVSEYTYESGVQRHNFGTSSNSYGTWFASGTYRHGLSNTFTLGLRGEALLDSQTFGVGFDGGLLRVGVISGGIAVSHDKEGHVAGLAYAQVQHSARSINFSLYAQAAQENFRQLGLLPTQRPTQFLGQAQIGYMFGKWISVSAGAMHQEKPSNLEAAQQKSSPTTWSFNYTGGAVLLHRDALLSRSLTDGFAVVDTNGAPGVKVLANNNYGASRF
jgi:outer membrane usher protein